MPRVIKKHAKMVAPGGLTLKKWVEEQQNFSTAEPKLKSFLRRSVMPNNQDPINSIDVACALGTEHKNLRSGFLNYSKHFGITLQSQRNYSGVKGRPSENIILTPMLLAGFLMTRQDKFGAWLGMAALELIADDKKEDMVLSGQAIRQLKDEFDESINRVTKNVSNVRKISGIFSKIKKISESQDSISEKIDKLMKGDSTTVNVFTDFIDEEAEEVADKDEIETFRKDLMRYVKNLEAETVGHSFVYNKRALELMVVDHNTVSAVVRHEFEGLISESTLNRWHRTNRAGFKGIKEIVEAGGWKALKAVEKLVDVVYG